jgi:hypothetical protein
MNTTETTETVKTSDLRIGDKLRGGDRFDGFIYFTVTGIKIETLMTGRKVTRVSTNINRVGSVHGAGTRWNRVVA